MTLQPHSIAPFLPSSEGRWPRICELHERPGDTRVAMLSVHTSPLAALGRSRDAGGMNVYVRELAKHLGRRGVTVDIFTRWTDPTLPQIIPLGLRARLIHIPAGPISPIHKDHLFDRIPAFVAGVECFAISERTDYDIIHSHYWLSGVAGMELARRWGAPHVTMFHTLARLKQRARPEERESDLRIQQERRIMSAADGLVVATRDEREQIARLYALPSSQISIIPCGVDLGRFTPADRATARAQFARAWNLGDDPLLLFVGRLDPLKGAELLVQSMPLLRSRAVLAIVGGDEHDSERPRLEALARKLGVADRIRFIDAAPQDALPQYYRAADLLAVASHYESFGLVAVEALACGTPVIAPRVGGLPAIIQDGVNGALVDPRTPASYAARLDALLGDPARLAALQVQARPSVRQFGWHHIARQISDVYQELRTPAYSAAAWD